ncbi:MAG: PhoU domain-containing protein [Acidimicrobiia bacterium]|nr:PhoU domain-containing protein [Acidimicrobiia bacterium]
MFEFFKNPGDSAIESVEQMLTTMLVDGHEVYTTASDALFGGGKSKETKKEVRSTDKGINQAQRDVRRELLLHAAVAESVDIPLVLSYMSVVKDAERIGDYAKNIYDLVRYGADFENAPDLEVLINYREAVGDLILQAASVYEARDEERARQLVEKADGFLDEHDAEVKAAFNMEGAVPDAVARALYFRFLKRITAHIMNLLTALVLPVDQLDYYDEAKEDRGDSD